MRVPTGWTGCYIEEDDYEFSYETRDASPDIVTDVVTSSSSDPMGRSQWMWLRLPDGTLYLAVLPPADITVQLSDAW